MKIISFAWTTPALLDGRKVEAWDYVWVVRFEMVASPDMRQGRLFDA